MKIETLIIVSHSDLSGVRFLSIRFSFFASLPLKWPNKEPGWEFLLEFRQLTIFLVFLLLPRSPLEKIEWGHYPLAPYSFYCILTTVCMVPGYSANLWFTFLWANPHVAKLWLISVYDFIFQTSILTCSTSSFY